MLERHADGVSRREGAGVADDPGALAIPTHRVAAAQHRQRAQPFEARGRIPEASLAAVQPSSDRGVEASVLGEKRRPDPRQAMARIELPEPALHRIEASASEGYVVSRGVPQLTGELTQVACAPGQPPWNAGESRSRQQRVQA